MNHIMLDLETLSSQENAAIIAIGAVRFDLEKLELGKMFYVIVDPESSLNVGLHLEFSTIKWWMQQSDAARAIFNSAAAIGIHAALEAFTGFVKEVPDSYIWGNGATFDNMIMRNAYRACQIENPTSFRHDICYRTVKTLFPEVTIERKGTGHNALDDAVYQASKLIKIMKGVRKVNDVHKVSKARAAKA